jgi:hypothetical protein
MSTMVKSISYHVMSLDCRVREVRKIVGVMRDNDMIGMG